MKEYPPAVCILCPRYHKTCGGNWSTGEPERELVELIPELQRTPINDNRTERMFLGKLELEP